MRIKYTCQQLFPILAKWAASSPEEDDRRITEDRRARFSIDTLSGICAYSMCMGATRKSLGKKSVRVNITIPPHLFQAGQDLVRTDLYGSFADMIQGLIRERVKRCEAAPTEQP
jgi:hypothetical protein